MKQSRLNYLQETLSELDFQVSEGQKLHLTEARLRKAGYYEDVAALYRKLDGRGAVPVLEVNCDLMVGEQPVFLDTDLHFNRYRLITLRASFYAEQNLFSQEKYRRFCRMYEKDCLKSGQRDGIWTNAQAETYFGEASEAGDFFGPGAPGWKLTAYKDLLADAAVLFSGKPVLRLPVHEKLMAGGKLIKIQKLFESRNAQSTEILQNYLSRFLQTDQNRN